MLAVNARERPRLANVVVVHLESLHFADSLPVECVVINLQFCE